MRLWHGLTRNSARTHPQAGDPRLRGRVYALPYRQVWQAVQETAEGMPRWTLGQVDARGGVLQAEARTLMWKFVDDVEVRVSLDADGWTRVDATSASRVGGADLGTNARRIARFLHRLDARLPPPGRQGEPDQTRIP